MPTIADFERDYWAPDRESVLADISAGRWRGDESGRPSNLPAQQMQEQQQQAVRPWDRTAFRDEWMGSGINTVPGMQQWLKNTGWGSQVGQGGSKGDLMYLPGGETMDAVLAAGLGGGRGGPQWTPRGNWMQQGMQPFQGASPSAGMFSNQFANMFGQGQGQGQGQGWGMPGQQVGQQGGMFNRMYNRPMQMQQRMNPTTGQRFQSRGFGQQSMGQMRQPSQY